MYYNLKINTKDSEFGLESTDKAIIQREMDIYFALLFNASKDFIAKIQKTTVVKPAVTDEAPKVNEQNRQNIVEMQKPDFDNVQNTQAIPEIQNFNPADFQNTQNNTSEINQPQPENNNLFMPEINVSNTPEENAHIEHQTENNSEAQINNIFFAQNEPPKENIEQKQIDIVPMDEDKEFEKEAEILFNELKTQIKNEEDNQKTEVEQIIQNENNVIQDEIPQPQQSNIPYQEIINNYKDRMVDILQPSDNNYQDIVNEYKERGIDTNNYSNMIEKQVEESKREYMEAQQTSGKQTQSNEINTADIQDIDMSQNINFNAYLGGFLTDKIEDEFLVCASYIKNVLKQSDFTMKYINSKLFQATGKIADTSVVDELIKKEYINNVASDDFAKYTITEKGDQYLITIQD